MKFYQITKYNPKYRDTNGKYQHEEWTSISDIGSMYSGEIFCDNEYFRTENSYIGAIEIVMKQYNIKSMYVNGLEKYNTINDFGNTIQKYPQYYPDKLISIFETVTEGSVFSIEEVLLISRLILREHLWCNLYSSNNNLKIFFGYDYYMKMECNEFNAELISALLNLGLFVECISD